MRPASSAFWLAVWPAPTTAAGPGAAVSTPQIYPIASLAATPDGSVLVAGGQSALARSDDGGATWSELPLDGEPAAIAVPAGGRTVAVVTRSTDYFRSDDGGRTWPAP